jgi:uncharacterized protein YigE (DUF2233 family)
MYLKNSRPMNSTIKRKAFVFLSALLLIVVASFAFNAISPEEKIVSYTVDLKYQHLEMYWKNDNGEILRSIQQLKKHVEGKGEQLVFAMNGGIFMANWHPLGLFIQNGTVKKKLNTAKGAGNFYVMPNGVFYTTRNNIPFICKTSNFVWDKSIAFATQSGPMLVIEGKINTEFAKGSTKINIRNGVGILPDNKIIFAISRTEVNMYDFADFFKAKGCKNALYLDGYVSKMYLPEKNLSDTGGDFGVMIGLTKKKTK